MKKFWYQKASDIEKTGKGENFKGRFHIDSKININQKCKKQKHFNFIVSAKEHNKHDVKLCHTDNDVSFITNDPSGALH